MGFVHIPFIMWLIAQSGGLVPLRSLSRHRFGPIDLVGVAPVESSRSGEELEEERREQVPEPHLDRISHDLALTRAAPIPDHAFDARSTQTLIGRKGL